MPSSDPHRFAVNTQPTKLPDGTWGVVAHWHDTLEVGDLTEVVSRKGGRNDRPKTWLAEITEVIDRGNGRPAARTKGCSDKTFDRRYREWEAAHSETYRSQEGDGDTLLKLVNAGYDVNDLVNMTRGERMEAALREPPVPAGIQQENR